MRKLLRWLSTKPPATPSSSNGSAPNGTSTSRISAIQRNYQDFQDSANLDQILKRKLVAKSLNVPWDEMRDITTTNEHHHHGSGLLPWLLLLGLPLGAFAFKDEIKDWLQPDAQPSQEFVDTDTDTNYFLDFGEVPQE